MSLPEKHQQLHKVEVRCDSEGGTVTVRITDGCNQQVGPGKEGDPVNMGSSKPCKYSISSSCSSGELGVPRAMMTRLSSPRRVPPLFERSAAQCWDPKFNSAILEEACRERCFPQMQRRFRYILFYLATAALVWGIYFGINSTRCDPINFLVPTAGFLVLCLLLLWFTFSRPYARYYNHTSLLLTVIMFGITLAPQTHTAHFAHFDVQKTSNHSLLPTSQNAPCISPVGTFSLCIEVLLLLYSVLHLPLYVSVLLGLLYSVLYEALGWLHLAQMDDSYVGSERSDLHTLSWLGLGKVLLHLCAHIIGIHIFIMSEVRSRSTFLKVGQAIMHGKGLEVEKALKERMIHSVMPRLVADKLMKQGDEESESSGKRYSAGTCSVAPASATTSSSPKSNKHKKNSIPRGQIIFRPFNMKRMEPVSILFADIVGFTKMSANKSAPALVGLLNDLFGRFDRLCELTRCEKISTLGDCYYCVAGCPEPHTDHAYCCVDMGLGMIQAIEQFCQETSETVDMRVGVHTGTVLCGILGMKRFKFDVWSNDVNLANLMEQLGVAGKVHLSEVTASFLDDRYEREDGRVMERVGHSVTDQLKGLKTYLISGWKMGSQCGCSQLSLGRDFSEMLSPFSNTHTPDLTHCTVAEPLSHGKPVCAPCSISVDVVDNPVADEATRNGCQDEHRDNSSSKFPAGRSPKTLNGLLSPLCEERVGVSQSSLCDKLQEKNRSWVGSLAAEGGSASGMDHSAILPLRSKNFREKSDVHFVEVIKEDSLMKDYFFKPPINKLSLNFLEKSLESAYRTSYHAEVLNQVPVQTFASPVFSSLLDVLLSCAVFLALTFACFLYPLVTMETPLATTLCLAITATLVELVSLVLSIRMVFCLDDVQNCTRSLLKLVSGWLPRHVIGAVLVSLPAVSVFSHLAYSLQLPIQVTMFLCCALIIAIIQYCNFCQLSFWMRSTLATVAGLSLLILLYSATTRPRNMSNQSAEVDQTGELDSGPTALDLLVLETVLSFFLLLMLVWFLNREFEVSYRLHYHGNVEADKHRIKIQTMRDQADWLLRNIIPIHVAEQLEVNQSYSKNHENVGVIFASIVNFSEFYEESYEGGKECYRVLNELIGDFDELLRKPAFSNVEKIKTIGATYMAASGLNGQQCQEQPHPHTHLRALFDFALEMMRVVDDFNKNMLGFKFKLRIGFNHGPLTAGVIGTTKLLYDIWGDTVNIASRMDSTGVECRIQVSEESHCVLNRMNYAFDYRGTVNVKGKGQMRTYLYPQMNEGRSGSTQSLEQGQVDGAVGHLEPTTLANATTTTSAAPLNPPSTSPNVASISGHGVPQGRGLGPSQITEELHQDSKDNSPVPELKEKDYESPYQAPSLSGTQPPSIAQLYAPLARPETPLQGEEEDEADEHTKLRAVE
ncbi:adenylate cyclase type 9-like isoform X2 [Sinocyclocheilus rhinocerous]|uniref:adenylate cyclase n=1 Tax=Sinocyclocheilus rhinocerous TaxID=307959 RepID=A0A673IUU3_9TELE|nr:PREDICTED: adenylate cyclase type 9-like isoform X2 [Sinocyclocheilus rhinocerous]